jgi:hypothetical protein
VIWYGAVSQLRSSMNLTSRIQRAVIRSSPYPPFRWMYGAAYGAMLLWLMMRVRRIPEIRYLELRAPRKGHRFGSSDLDLRAETTQLGGAGFFALSDRLADVLQPSKRWKRILDFYIFGPAEAKLQRRLGPISFGESRWIRLVGDKSVPESGARLVPEPASNAALCRTMYEYGCILQELFEGSTDRHSAWTLYRRMSRIDDGLGLVPGALDSECAQLRSRIRTRTDLVARGGSLREMRASEREELFALALSEADSITHSSECPAASARDSNFQAVADPIRPDNLTEAIASCSIAVRDLCERLSGLVQSAILGCVPATSFDYRVYLVLRDGLGIKEHFEVFRIIREMYTAKDNHRRIPNTYLRLRHPMVLTPTMWRASCRWYHALRPVEEFFFFKRHGVVLWGSDLRGELREPSPIDVIRSAAIAASDLRNGIWGAVHARRPRQLADALLGRVPALWLLLAQSTIATSSPEALAACAREGFPQSSVLDELRRGVPGTRPQDLPGTDSALWKPALEASSIWMDEITAMALARLESRCDATPRMAGRLGAHGEVRPVTLDRTERRL